jgi:NAD/NADP transhydrogenase beta subunit
LKVPIGIAILTYTLVYLVYIIAINHLETSNIPTLMFFPGLILADIIWNITNKCFKPFGIIIALIVGGGIGAAWAALIDSFKQPGLFFLNVGSDKVVCQRPSKQLFKCTFAK